MISLSLQVVGIAALSACMAEGLSYIFLYRQDNYVQMKAAIERTTKKLGKKKEQGVDSEKKQKKLDKAEDQLKQMSRDLAAVKMKSMLVVSISFVALLYFFNSWFHGQVIAKLPFEPLSFIQGASHRGLEGSDPTDCSFVFLYMLCMVTFRQSLQKALGFSLSRDADKMGQLFQPPKMQ